MAKVRRKFDKSCTKVWQKLYESLTKVVRKFDKRLTNVRLKFDKSLTKVGRKFDKSSTKVWRMVSKPLTWIWIFYIQVKISNFSERKKIAVCNDRWVVSKLIDFGFVAFATVSADEIDKLHRFFHVFVSRELIDFGIAAFLPVNVHKIYNLLLLYRPVSTKLNIFTAS